MHPYPIVNTIADMSSPHQPGAITSSGRYPRVACSEYINRIDNSHVACCEYMKLFRPYLL
jgi:hypothetical protein